MNIKKLLFVLFCSFAIQSMINAQTDSIVKAKVLDDGSQDAEKFYNSGISNFANKNFSAALNDFNQAVTLKPDFERAYYNRGATKFEMKDYNAAIADFDKALTINETADSYFSRGQAKYALWELVDKGTFRGLIRNGKTITKTYNGNEESLWLDVKTPSKVIKNN